MQWFAINYSVSNGNIHGYCNSMETSFQVDIPGQTIQIYSKEVGFQTQCCGMGD